MRGYKTPPEKVVQVLDAASVTTSGPALARMTGVADKTARDLLERYTPLANVLRDFKRDHFVSGHQWLYLETLDALQAESAAGTLTFQRRQQGATTMAICTDKVLALNGMPTQIVANLHEVRINLPEIMGRLLRAAPPPA